MWQNIVCLMQKRGAAIDEASGIAETAMNETRGMKPEEMVRVKHLKGEIERLSVEIAQARAHQAKMAATSVALPNQ